MDVALFEKSPVGHLVPISGHDSFLDVDYSHAFVPNPAPSVLNLSQATYKAVSDAALALGRLDFAVRRLPAPRLLVGPVLRREAQSTSELEGTYAPLDEVFAAALEPLASVRYPRNPAAGGRWFGHFISPMCHPQISHSHVPGSALCLPKSHGRAVFGSLIAHSQQSMDRSRNRVVA